MDVTDHSVPVSDLVMTVKSAVKHANISATDTGRDLRVSAVYLTLNAVATTKLGGGLDFRVPVIGWKVQAGGSRTRQHTHTINITLVPEDVEAQYELRDSEVEETLVEAITTIRAAIAAGAGGDDPLVLDAGTVELVFAVTAQGTVSVGAEGELIDEITHTLKVRLIRAKMDPDRFIAST